MCGLILLHRVHATKCTSEHRQTGTSHYGPAECHSMHRRVAVDGQCSSFSTGLEGHAVWFVPLGVGWYLSRREKFLRYRSRHWLRCRLPHASSISLSRANLQKSDRYLSADAGTFAKPSAAALSLACVREELMEPDSWSVSWRMVGCIFMSCHTTLCTSSNTLTIL